MNEHPPVQRVLITSDTLGGVFTHALTLAAGLVRRGVEVGMATMGAPLDQASRDAVTKEAGARLFESRFRLEWMEDPWNDVDAAGEWLLDVERQLRPDVVHLNQYSFGALPWRTPTLVGGHSCVLSWWRAVRGEDAPRRYDEYRRRVAAGLAHTRCVVAPSRTMLDWLTHHYGPFGEGSVVYNGCDPDGFPPKRKEPFVLAAGRIWDEAKNMAALDRIAGRISWPVRVAGSRAAPSGSVATLTSAEALGPLSQAALSDLYGRASVYALPARYEPFGLSILEAGLAGCALVLGDTPSLREIWGDCAFFVAPDDDDELLAAIERLISNCSLREDWGARARRHAQAFTFERMMGAYLSLYSRLSSVEKGRARRAPCV
jgi:glycogen synthase